MLRLDHRVGHRADRIDQENYLIDAKLSHEWTLGKTALKVGFARFDDKQRETENESQDDHRARER